MNAVATRKTCGILLLLAMTLLACTRATAEDDQTSERTQPGEDSVESLTRDANEGDATAQFNLGVMYAHGEGVPENDTEAVNWYRRAAEQGHAKAQFILGAMYGTGEGTIVDLVQSYAWINLAASHGLEDAR